MGDHGNMISANHTPRDKKPLTASASGIASMMQAYDPWNLNFPLFQWSPYDAFTLRNAVESVAIFGELGAAKTTGSAAWILLKY